MSVLEWIGEWRLFEHVWGILVILRGDPVMDTKTVLEYFLTVQDRWCVSEDRFS